MREVADLKSAAAVASSQIVALETMLSDAKAAGKDHEALHKALLTERADLGCSLAVESQRADEASSALVALQASV